MKNYHDKAYKKLFSNKEIVQQLFEYFIDEDFVQFLDFSTLQKMDKSFVTDEYKEKESDLIYQIHFKNKPMYIYMLIEFQSTVDPMMPLRFLRYICEFYEDLKNHQTGLKKLPAIFPLLIYNGEKKWTSKLNINELIEKTISDRYIPNFSYYKLSINELSEEMLSEINNTLSFIFTFENSSPKELSKKIKTLLKRIEHEKPEAIKTLKKWINNFFKQQNLINNTKIIESISKLEEIEIMFTSALKKELKESYDEGKLKGIEEGKLKGIEEGKLNSIIRLHNKLGLSIEEISEGLDLDIDEVRNILSKYVN